MTDLDGIVDVLCGSLPLILGRGQLTSQNIMKITLDLMQIVEEYDMPGHKKNVFVVHALDRYYNDHKSDDNNSDDISDFINNILPSVINSIISVDKRPRFNPTPRFQWCFNLSSKIKGKKLKRRNTIRVDLS